mgnify:CR=1 FL=1
MYILTKNNVSEPVPSPAVWRKPLTGPQHHRLTMITVENLWRTYHMFDDVFEDFMGMLSARKLRGGKQSYLCSGE